MKCQREMTYRSYGDLPGYLELCTSVVWSSVIEVRNIVHPQHPKVLPQDGLQALLLFGVTMSGEHIRVPPLHVLDDEVEPHRVKTVEGVA